MLVKIFVHTHACRFKLAMYKVEFCVISAGIQVHVIAIAVVNYLTKPIDVLNRFVNRAIVYAVVMATTRCALGPVSRVVDRINRSSCWRLIIQSVTITIGNLVFVVVDIHRCNRRIVFRRSTFS